MYLWELLILNSEQSNMTLVLRILVQLLAIPARYIEGLKD
jgi:hypothetical protein